MIIGFWLIVKGESPIVEKRLLNKRVIVGIEGHQIAIIYRREIKNYVDTEMYRQYDIWSRFHKGMGLPMSKSWAEHPAYLINIIDTMESEWKYVEH